MLIFLSRVDLALSVLGKNVEKNGLTFHFLRQLTYDGKEVGGSGRDDRSAADFTIAGG